MKKHDQKSLVKKACVAFKLWKIRILVMTSEVKFDLGGQRSFATKINMWSKNISKKVWLKKLVLLQSYGSLKFKVWLLRSNLTSEVSLTSEVKFEVALQLRIVKGGYIPNFVKIGLLEVKI